MTASDSTGLAQGLPRAYPTAMAQNPKSGVAIAARIPEAEEQALRAILATRNDKLGPLDPPVTLTRWLREKILGDAAALGIEIEPAKPAAPAPKAEPAKPAAPPPKPKARKR